MSEPRISDEHGSVEQRLEEMKREVDALQVHVMREKAPWWKQVPVVVTLLVSLAALAFSFWSFQRGEARLDRQQEHEARSELRDLVVRLVELPTEALELTRKFADDPSAQANANAEIGSETRVLADQAADLILVDLHGEATAPEYYSVIDAFLRSGEPTANLEELIVQGLRVANDPVSAATLYRFRGGIRFNVGDVEEGRKAFTDALNVFAQFPSVELAPNWVSSTKAQTHAVWAEHEAARNFCPLAWHHLALAERTGGYDTRSAAASVKKYCPKTPPTS